MHAKVVNQGGILQVNSVRNINGVIELVANDSLNIANNSVVSAKGEATGTSPGGFVVARSSGAFHDAKGSTIDVSGGANAGSAGVVELFGTGVSASTLQSQINGQNAADYTGFALFNPKDITLSLSPNSASGARANFEIAALADYAQIDIHAANDITLNFRGLA